MKICNLPTREEEQRGRQDHCSKQYFTRNNTAVLVANLDMYVAFDIVNQQIFLPRLCNTFGITDLVKMVSALTAQSKSLRLIEGNELDKLQRVSSLLPR